MYIYTSDVSVVEETDGLSFFFFTSLRFLALSVCPCIHYTSTQRVYYVSITFTRNRSAKRQTTYTYYTGLGSPLPNCLAWDLARLLLIILFVSTPLLAGGLDRGLSFFRFLLAAIGLLSLPGLHTPMLGLPPAVTVYVRVITASHIRQYEDITAHERMSCIPLTHWCRTHFSIDLCNMLFHLMYDSHRRIHKNIGK